MKSIAATNVSEHFLIIGETNEENLGCGSSPRYKKINC